MKNLTLLTAFVLLFSGCKKLPSDRGIIIRDFQNTNFCESQLIQWIDFDNGRIIRNQSDLDSLSNQVSCQVEGEVNFSSESLIFKAIPMSIGYEFTSKVDNITSENKYKVTVYIKENRTGNKMPVYGVLAIVVPAIPDNYSVEFERVLISR